jgi:hypothetical protein
MIYSAVSRRLALWVFPLKLCMHLSSSFIPLRLHGCFSFSRGLVAGQSLNPQPGGPGYPLLSGPSPSTCPASVALPVASATAGIALRIIWPRKPSHLAFVIEFSPFPCYLSPLLQEKNIIHTYRNVFQFLGFKRYLHWINLSTANIWSNWTGYITTTIIFCLRFIYKIQHTEEFYSLQPWHLGLFWYAR